MPHAVSSVAWLVELTDVAPGVDLTTLRIVACLLAGGADVEALRLVVGALDARVAELALDRRSRAVAELQSIVALIEVRIDELEHRRGTFW